MPRLPQVMYRNTERGQDDAHKSVHRSELYLQGRAWLCLGIRDGRATLPLFVACPAFTLYTVGTGTWKALET